MRSPAVISQERHNFFASPGCKHFCLSVISLFFNCRYLHLDLFLGLKTLFGLLSKLHFCLSIYILSPPHVLAVNKFSNLLHFCGLTLPVSDLAIWLSWYSVGTKLKLLCFSMAHATIETTAKFETATAFRFTLSALRCALDDGSKETQSDSDRAGVERFSAAQEVSARVGESTVSITLKERHFDVQHKFYF